MIVMLLMISFAVAIPLTSKAIENNSNGNEEQNQIQSNTQNEGEDDSLQNQIETKEFECEEWTCTKWSNCTTGQQRRACTKITNCTEEQETPKTIKECKEKERISPVKKSTDCPENCTCTGSATKCILADGTREMTITAGNSGNIIIQIKGIDGTTNVTLYKADDGKIYGTFKNNETKRIKLLPDQVKEKIQERTQKMLENDNIVLNEDGIYEYRAEKKARLFYLIPVRERIRAELNSENGEFIRIRNPWWGFLAKDEGETIVGASCGTVTPGENNNCCINKGYDLWNAETSECEFNDEE